MMYLPSTRVTALLFLSLYHCFRCCLFLRMRRLNYIMDNLWRHTRGRVWRNKTAPVVRSWTHPIRGAVKSSLWVLVPFLACAVCTNLVDVGFEGIWKARSSRVSLFVLWAEAVPVRLETTTTPNWGCLFGVPSSNKALPGEVRPFCWLTNTSLKSKKRYLMLWFSFWSQLARVLNIFSSGC